MNSLTEAYVYRYLKPGEKEDKWNKIKLTYVLSKNLADFFVCFLFFLLFNNSSDPEIWNITLAQ